MFVAFRGDECSLTSEQVCRREDVTLARGVVPMAAVGESSCISVPCVLECRANSMAPSGVSGFHSHERKNVSPIMLNPLVREFSRTLGIDLQVKSLILAQNERWRRG